MWFKTEKPLRDGWHWWRASEKDTDPQVVQISNGSICDICSDADGDAVYYEHQDFSGEWFGPIYPPK